MKFYDPSEKIKAIRKKLHMNQIELEGKNMTRAFISMMESGKRKVSCNSSRLLAKKFNDKAKQLGVQISLDDEYFSRKPSEDAEIYCEGELAKEISHEKYEELLKISSDFKLDVIAMKAYKKDADKYFNEENYEIAFEKYSNALGKLKELNEIEEQSYVYNQMGISKLNRREYEEAIFYFNQAIFYAHKEIKEKRIIEVAYNLAKAYSNIKLHNESLKVIDRYISDEEGLVNTDFNLGVNIIFLKTRELYNSGKKNEAVSKYLYLIDLIGDRSNLVLIEVFNDLADYYYNIANIQESLKYINLAQRLEIKTDKVLSPKTLCTKAKIFFTQGLVDESIMIFELSMNISEQVKNFTSLFSTYKELAVIYKSLGELERLKEASMFFLQVLEKYNKNEGKEFALCNLVEISISQENEKESIKLLRELEEIFENQ
ncbi:helix-turn-helix transcriptional regulator [Clostridium sp. C8-1-8]|uniref:helix-turn-helix domain-containing protein n=1 Tax=Clostridium sp. C8-1-8 TaxID=2698831 RepID=UPI00136DB0B3|nr:helix-turn-helix transcriptional regulator [Clostridium sp. C8-1-8]